MKQSVPKQKTVLDPFDDDYCSNLIKDGLEVFKKAKAKSVIQYNGDHKFGAFTLEQIQNQESYFCNLVGKVNVLKIKLKEVGGSRANLVMENQEFREEKDKYEGQFARLRKELKLSLIHI